MRSPAFLRTVVFPLALIAASQPLAMAADGTWLAAGDDGMWSDPDRWLNGTIADGTGSTLTLQAPGSTAAPAPGSLIGGFALTLDDDYVLQNITLAAGTWSNTAAYRITGDYDLAFAGSAAPTVTVVTSPAAILEISTKSVSGNQGVAFTGSGVVHWNPTTNLIQGDFTLSSANVVVTRSAALGDMNIRMSGGGPRLWVAPGTGDLSIANHIVLGVNGPSQSAGLRWYSASSGVVTLSGDISQANPSFVSNFAYTTGTGQGQQRYVVSGDNSYKGDTRVGDGGSVLVLAKSNTAFGAGEGAQVIAGTATAGVGLAGGITISDKKVTLNGAGYSGTGFDGVTWSGSLFSQSGENEWTGEVALGTGANPRIGVATGSRLLISGEITGSAVGGLQKSGGGVLELSVANSHTTGTTVTEGVLLVSHSKALADGPVTVQSGATLAINTGILSEIASLDLASGGALSFSLNSDPDATGLRLSGNQTGSGIYDITILDGGNLTEGNYTLLTVEGTAQANDFRLASMASGYLGNLDWNNGVLTLNVTAIPEPGTALLVAGSFLMGVILRKKLN